MSIQSEIAKIGQSPEFVVAMAHAWFGSSVLLILAHWGLTLWIGALDFSEYMAGLALAVLIITL